MAFEENEVSKNSQGGTEMVKRGLAERLPEGLADDFQVICSRVRELEEDKIRIYWLHDLPEDPETNHLKDENSRNRFHRLVFCGNWQYNRYRDFLGIAPSKDHLVIETPIDPFEAVEKKISKSDKIRLIYTSTPQRGLQLLVPVFKRLAEKYDNIHLDVFSSFKIYGWEEADKNFEPLYDEIREHPQMTYHGFAPNNVVREHLLDAHILAYPSIWLECNSRSVIEAMSAGVLCVHPNTGGLADTAGGMNYMYQSDADLNMHAGLFYHALENAITVVQKEESQQYLKFVKAYADSRYNWTKIAAQWKDLMQGLKQQYPTVESRKIPADIFTYKTI